MHRNFHVHLIRFVSGHNIADVAAEAASFSINTETIAVAIKELDKCLKVTENSGALSAALSAGAAAGVTGIHSQCTQQAAFVNPVAQAKIVSAIPRS